MNKVTAIFHTFIGMPIIEFCARHVLRNTRLMNLPMLPIGASLNDAVELYGDPDEVKQDDEDPNKEDYSFDMYFHEVIATIENNKVTKVTYWTNEKDARPDEDLSHVLQSYSDGYEWTDLTQGYSAVRKDGRRRADFSAIPAICVREVDFPKVRETWGTN